MKFQASPDMKSVVKQWSRQILTQSASRGLVYDGQSRGGMALLKGAEDLVSLSCHILTLPLPIRCRWPVHLVSAAVLALCLLFCLS
jgi:hypothetical protein